MTSLRRRVTGTGGSALAVVLGVSLSGPVGAAELPGPAAAGPQVDHVVLVSLDGLNPRALRLLGRESAPALHRMRRNGAGTLNARTLHDLTVTLPNHTSMVTGVPATGDGGHAVTVNEDPGGTVHDLAGRHVGSVFEGVHDAGGSTSLRATKDKFALFHRSWRAGVDRFRVARAGRVVDSLVDELRHDPATLSFLHLGVADRVGHRHGFLGPRYLRAVRRLDDHVGRILRTVRTSPELDGRTVVLVTADHGGRSDGHDDPTLRSSYRVPFLAWGAGVARGADLYDLNPQRSSPRRSRTDYSGAQPVRNGDAANLVLDLLGLPPLADSRFGVDQELTLSR